MGQVRFPMPLAGTLLMDHRIENYCIPIAATAPIIRLFIRTFVDQRRENMTYCRSGSVEGQSKIGNTLELGHRSNARSYVKGFSQMASRDRDRDRDEISDDVSRRSHEGSEKNLVDHNGIMVKQEYEVRVENKDVNKDLP